MPSPSTSWAQALLGFTSKMQCKELGNVRTQGRVAGGALSPRERGEFAAWAASVMQQPRSFQPR